MTRFNKLFEGAVVNGDFAAKTLSHRLHRNEAIGTLYGDITAFDLNRYYQQVAGEEAVTEAMDVLAHLFNQQVQEKRKRIEHITHLVEAGQVRNLEHKRDLLREALQLQEEMEMLQEALSKAADGSFEEIAGG